LIYNLNVKKYLYYFFKDNKKFKNEGLDFLYHYVNINVLPITDDVISDYDFQPNLLPAGFYKTEDKLIYINFNNENKIDQIQTICHEIGHVIQDIVSEGKEWDEYHKSNLTFYQVLKNEWEADTIGCILWKWLYPINKEEYRWGYSTKDDIRWLKDYYSGCFEDDYFL
jgi:hypothetical protein